jgi:alkylation response protein AidB-like acyl-CoA dehydrogenase
MLATGIARVLIPRHFGGYDLGLDAWFEVVREIGTVDASHAWCASLMILHARCVGQLSSDAQKVVWSDGPVCRCH